MKAIKIITHPAVLIISFLFILISGEDWGGFYLTYLLLALPHAGIHALLAVAGLLILASSRLKFKDAKKQVIEPLLNITGAVCLVLSLYVFFHNDRSGYNNGTFEQFLPLITVLLFGLITIGFVVFNFLSLPGIKKINADLSLK
jgi:hypothetical protein